MSKHTIITAEAGVNHNGSIELAKQLVDKAGEAGLDYTSSRHSRLLNWSPRLQSRRNTSRRI